MYWNILVWLRIEIPDGFLHQISENLKIDDLVTGGTINLQLTQRHHIRLMVMGILAKNNITIIYLSTRILGCKAHAEQSQKQHADHIGVLRSCVIGDV